MSHIRPAGIVGVLLIVLVCPALAPAACPTADLNRDCRVDLADLADFGRAWLLTSCTKPACLADFTGDQAVLLPDLMILANEWLRDDNRPVRIKWLGHASLKIWINEYTIYVDPVNSSPYYQLTDSPHDADLVLVTHSHSDHYSPADIAKVWRTGATFVGPQDVTNPNGQRQIILPGQTLSFGNLSVTGVPTNNSNHPRSKNWLGFIIEVGLVRIYVAGDTSRIAEMKTLGDISVAFLPIDGNYNMGPAEAALAAGDIQPDLAIPYHWFNANPQTFASLAPCPTRVLTAGQTIASEDWMANPPLIGHWPLDESSGTVAHDLASGNTGLVSGAPVWQPTAGRVNGACLFDGLDDYIDLPMIFNPSSGPFSAFAWVKGVRPTSVVIAQTDGTGTGRIWLSCDDAGNLLTRLTDGTAALLTAPVAITDDAWHLVGVVWDGSRRHLYADGIEVAADTLQLGKLNSSNGRLYIGAGKTLSASTRWLGAIDEVEIYNKALSPAEIPTH
jgi:L-ascorbate metabolism protein UlaG (beta-lactamase superfamily)